MLAIAERLIDRRSTRIDRAGVLLHLAAQVAAAPPGDATAWLRTAFGLRTPRHVGVPEADPDQIAEPGRTSWLAAPPAPVVAHLRTGGCRKPERETVTAGFRQLAQAGILQLVLGENAPPDVSEASAWTVTRALEAARALPEDLISGQSRSGARGLEANARSSCLTASSLRPTWAPTASAATTRC